MTGTGTRVGIAVTVAAGVVVSSPFVGRVRDALQTAFPGQYRAVIVAVVAVAIGGALAAAALSIRNRRLFRFGSLVAAVIIGVAYARFISTGNADVDAVERFHFVEYGLIAFLFYRAARPYGGAAAFALPVCASLITAFADEWLQWFVPARYGDLRDVLLNAVAIACGLLFAVGVEPPVRAAADAPSPRVVRGALAATVLAGAAFVQAVHIGHRIEDPAVGAFRSRYRAGTLIDLAAERTPRWAQEPPTARPGLAREDQYLAEGQWHVQRRNEAMSAGDGVTAWRENLILEKFYAPVLDLGSRWPADQRANVAALVRPAPPAAYVSDAEPYPLLTVAPVVFWAATVAVATAVLVPLRRRAPSRRRVAVV